MGCCSFPKSVRLCKRYEFIRVQRDGLRFRREGLIILLRPNQTAVTRLGITITRKSWPLAVRRNYLRRLLREAFRGQRHSLAPGWDVAVVVTRGAADITLAKAREALRWAINRRR